MREGASSSPVAAAVDAIVAEVVAMFDHWGNADRVLEPMQIRRFAEMINRTPALRAAQWEMLEQMGQVAAEGLALRARVSPDHPEPRIAANAILGLWRIELASMARHAGSGGSPAQVRDAVIADVHRAAHLIDTGLHSFGQESAERPRSRKAPR